MTAPAPFRLRYAAYTVDLLLLSPIALLLALPALRRAATALASIERSLAEGLDRAFLAGHVALLALAEALRTDLDFMAAMAAGMDALAGALLQALLIAWAVLVAWFVGFEASPWQASPGKRLLGLRVETLAGARMGVGRALLRFLAAGPSWLLLHLGHAMAAWRKDARALHDLVAGTRVPGPARLPAWAKAYLALQGAVFIAFLAHTGWNMLQAVLLLGL